MLSKSLILSAALFFFYQNIFSQDWQWAASAGGIYSDKATDMDIDTAGNIYVCGYYNENATFGTLNAPATFGKDGFLAKLDTAGNWIWLKTANGGWDERVLGMCSDRLGYVYVTGTCWYDTDFGSCSGAIFPGGSDNIFVAKLDLDGNCQWLIGAGGDSDDQGYDLIADPQGNIYLTGFISDEYSTGTSAQFGGITVPIPFGDSICFVAKINPMGIFQWVETFPGTDGERDNRIAIDSANNIYITGGFTGVQNFGTDILASAGGRDVFVIKYDSNGNYMWSQRAGSLLDDRANSITADIYGDIYITGEFRDKAGFGTDSINNNGGPNGRDIFVAKMKQSGEWVWAKKAGSGNGSERGDRIISNKLGNIFVTGQFKEGASFGGNITLQADSADSLQLFVASIDTTGKWQWALQGGGTYEDRGNSLVCDDSCNLYNAGYYKLNSIIGSDSLTGNGAKDIFVAKIINSCFDLPLPIAAFTANTYEICQSECISFTDTSVGSTGRTWIFNGGNPSMSTSKDTTVCYSVSGIYNVLLSVSNNYGTDTASATIIVHPPPAANAGTDTCIIAGTSITLTATGGGSYLWNTGDTTASTVISPAESGSYYVIVTLNNCTWGDGVNVNVHYPAEITGEKIICYGQSSILTASTGNSYVWSTGETSESITVMPMADSSFSVTITDVCDTASAIIAINVEPQTEAFAGNDTTIFQGTSAYLSASGGNNYLWNTGEITSLITVTPENTSIYTVTVTSNGCSGIDTVKVNVDASSSASVPSVFSPNGDGINDILYIRGRGIKEIEFSIFNRWGEKIFEASDINTGWDGTFNGRADGPSVFVYIIKGKFLNGSEINAKGNVTLIR